MNLQDKKELDIYVEEKTDETLMRKKIAEIVIAGTCILAAMATYYLSPVISAVILGIMFLLLGVAGLMYNKKTKTFPERNFLPAAFALLGLALGVVPLIGLLLIRIGHFGNDETDLIFALPEGILLLILGIMITIYPVYFTAEKKRRCTCYVTATCISPVIVWRMKGTPVYEHLWEFPLNGTTVRVSDRIQVTTEKPYAGATESFIVNPDDPNDLYRKRPFRSLFIMLFGIMLCVIAALILIPVCMF